MATGSTAHDLSEYGQARRRTQASQVAYNLPGDSRPEWVISAEYTGQPLQNDRLFALAEWFARVEYTLCEMSDVAYQVKLRSPVDQNNPASQEAAARSSDQHKQVMRQIEAIRDGSVRFSKTYLADEHILKLYTMASNHIQQFVHLVNDNDTQPLGWLKEHIWRMEEEWDQTLQKFTNAGSNGLIDDLTLNVCRRKWEILDEICSIAHKKWNTPERVNHWREIANASPEKSLDSVPEKFVSSTGGSQGNRFYRTLWLTVFAMICNSATFALAYKCSSPEPGTTRDDDFWLLLQGSMMQWFSLLIAGSALWSKMTLPMWTWMAPTIVALVSSLVAIPLYLHVPTAWSAFLTTVGSAVQAFMTVQLAAIGQ